MGEQGCLKDAMFNTLTVEGGGIEDTFPNGLGSLKGITIEPNSLCKFGYNQITQASNPTQ